MFVSLIDDRPKAISLSKFLVDEVNFSEGLNFVSMTSSLFQTPTRLEHLLVSPRTSALGYQIEGKCIWHVNNAFFILFCLL